MSDSWSNLQRNAGQAFDLLGAVMGLDQRAQVLLASGQSRPLRVEHLDLREATLLVAAPQHLDRALTARKHASAQQVRLFGGGLQADARSREVRDGADARGARLGGELCRAKLGLGDRSRGSDSRAGAGP